MRVRGGGPHDGPSDFSQLHTHLFCVAFVRHLSRTISDIRRAYRHWLGCHTFVNLCETVADPMHHGEDVLRPSFVTR